MKIARVTAHALNPPVPIKAPGIDRTVNRPIVFVEIETDAGIVGHGITSLAPAKGAAALIANTVTPLILGMDARRIADVWNAMYRELCHRGQTGLAYHAISAIDIALWDIRGKALKEPVWRLLGGARDKVPCYVTMGLPSMDRDQLASVAKHWVDAGHRRREDGGRRDRARPRARIPQHDRSAAGGRPPRQGGARRSRPQHRDRDRHQLRDRSRRRRWRWCGCARRYGLAFVEEPVPDNDARRMADFRRQTGLQIAAGQSMGALYRFKELLVQQAVDIIQPNVVNCGGYTGGMRVADMALGFATPICNGGGSTQHNLHLQAGAVNGTICEWHPYQSAGAVAAICPTAPKPQNGYLDADRCAGARLRSRPGRAEGVCLQGNALAVQAAGDAFLAHQAADFPASIRRSLD